MRKHKSSSILKPINRSEISWKIQRKLAEDSTSVSVFFDASVSLFGVVSVEIPHCHTLKIRHSTTQISQIFLYDKIIIWLLKIIKGLYSIYNDRIFTLRCSALSPPSKFSIFSTHFSNYHVQFSIKFHTVLTHHFTVTTVIFRGNYRIASR